jgi:hypothetical protein
VRQSELPLAEQGRLDVADLPSQTMPNRLRFGIRTLLGLSFVCASTCAGWLYFDNAGATLGAAGAVNLWIGIASLRSGITRRDSSPKLAIAAGIMFLALSVAAFGGLLYWFIYFQSEYGTGWWRSLHPEIYGE